MSVVTNVVLWCPLEDDITPIQEWLLKHCRSNLSQVNNQAGGNKVMEVDIWIGAFNYFDLPSFLDIVKDVKWRFRSDVCVSAGEDSPTHYRIDK